MRILRASEHKTYEWKNGKGSTTQLLIHPEDASLDTFDYRINTARVTGDEPFSRLPGVRRTMFILQGGGLRLALEGGKHVDITRDSPPFQFTGDSETDAHLIDGPTVDFNIMSRNGYDHVATRVHVISRSELDVTGSLTVLLCYEGSMSVQTDDGAVSLGPMDAVVADNASSSRWVLTAREPSTAYLISLRRV
jgi:uncharacterized protein